METSYHFSSSSLRPKLGVESKSHFFQSPQTPSAASSLYRSTSTISNSHAGRNVSRKRSRNDYTTSEQSTPHFGHDYSANPADSSAAASPRLTSPAPFVNTRYTLAGGLDTPAAAAAASFELHDSTSDLSYRRGGDWGNASKESSDSYFTAPLPREHSGRSHITSPPSAGWGTAVLSTAATVATKLWSFCTAGAFRGFYSGPDRGYALSTPDRPSLRRNASWQDIPTHPQVPSQNPYSQYPHVPGGFPTADFIPDYMSAPNAYTPSAPPTHSPTTHSPSARAAKKHKREASTDASIRSNWVLLPDSPTRTRTTASPAPHRRPASRAGMRRTLHSARPSPVSVQRPASVAALRSPTTASGKRMRLRDQGGVGRDEGAAEVESGEDEVRVSPAVLEAQRFAARVRRREVEEERDMRRMNARLKDLIREGKEALGTKVEVEDGDEEGEGEGEGEGRGW